MTVSTMTVLQRGAKHVCSDCACKYYDLGKKGAACPKCGGQPILQQLPRSGRPVKKSRRTTFGQYPNQPHPAAASTAGSDAASTASDDADSEAGDDAERTAGDDAELSEREPQL
jgi:uncharacterized protein (TIGR02300 family)